MEESRNHQPAEAHVKFSRSSYGWRLTLPWATHLFPSSHAALEAADHHGWQPYEGSVQLGFIGLRRKQESSNG